jgi:DNA-binding NarL/FixJ family response regulator
MTETPETPQNATRIRVLLADDHDLLRQGLKLLLSLSPEIEVIGEARTGREAVALTLDNTPDVVVMDISMAELDGLEACRLIRHQCLATQILILTMHESEEYFLRALRMGAAGYIVKKAAPTELQAAILTVARGGAYLYPGLAKALIRAYLTPSTAPTAPATSSPAGSSSALRVLTPREIEVLTLVAEGCTNQEIANQLGISIKTVQAHRASVMEKLELRDVTHLVRFALYHHLIAAEP